MQKDNFWENRPVTLSSKTIDIKQIVPNEVLLEKAIKDTECIKLKIEYKVYKNGDGNIIDENILKELLLFINKNYITNINDYKFIYTLELLRYFCKNSLLIVFYPIGKDNIIGCIVGKKAKFTVFDKKIDLVEANFLCLVNNLRNIGLGAYMINIIGKESILNYNIGISHYTISVPISIPYFSEKQFYHRMINIDILVKNKFIESSNINSLKNLYNKFKYDKKINKKIVVVDETNCSIYKNVIKNRINKYNKDTYDIYEEIDINDMLINKSFYNFLIINPNNSIEAFVSFFRADTQTNNGSYKNGYYYKMFFTKDSLIDSLEMINQYIYENKIFDVLTFCDIFNDNYTKMKCIKGNGNLKYYLFNCNSTKIPNHRNGLVTI
jgi:hypothetical protein